MTPRSAVEVAFPNPAALALSLPEVVYRQLREAILNGLYRPAQVLRQEELAARLGVSRAPLREALPRLEADGLVVSSPRRGYSVRSLEPEEIADACVFLLSDASRALTGANVLADLGMTSLLVGREPYSSKPVTGG